ncbi:MAG: hypothetical protein QG614_553 [Patescibacteria group bacterium]|nr:hypothetical protein [Patescibacteria group bacterium]
MSFLTNLEWRFATRDFDTNKKVSKEDIQKIKDAIRLSPSSYGLQPFKVIVVEDQKMKSKLTSISFNQRQIEVCSHLLVFVARTDIQTRIGEYAELLKKRDGLFDRIKFEAGARAFFGIKYADEEKKLRIAADQAYLALGFALAACAELKIDSCPMEGFDQAAYREFFNLKEDDVPVAIMAFGYRS